ncbi:MAG: hypothetical protein H3C36_08170 [Chitinophagaceae bacterium]|nr:hypothetical protein [Chitinophagaceae bacterium]MCW5913932.1 hypothetical protein [Chitinophagaceae bacterium]MCZ2397957.1 hypothetical protein [Chitinophagales bacterium]
MDHTNMPVSVEESPKPNKGKNIVIGVLSAAVLGLGGFAIYNNNKSNEEIQTQQTEIEKVVSEKSELQTNFDASLARLDSLTSMNNDLKTQMSAKDAEIAKIKSEIRSILNKKNATAAELAQAKKLIDQLNGQITSMQEEIAALQQENTNLKEENTGLVEAKQTLTRSLDSTTVVNSALTEKVDVASTLNASNITIVPVKVKNSGKEKTTTKAKAADKLVVKFDVTNRIIQSGSTDIYVVVIGPDGTPVTNTPNSGRFMTREQGEKSFTAKLPVTLETSKTKSVEFSFVPEKHFEKGQYKIEIYQNGFLIGEGTRQLKKGGLFG